MSWAESPRTHALPDGRLRLTHGPIDLVIAAAGSTKAVASALSRGRAAFQTILHDLAGELPRLRSAQGADPKGEIAQNMLAATAHFKPQFITPMASVAGAVADHILRAMLTPNHGPNHGLSRVIANNGGDIACWQSTGEMILAICEDPARRSAGARATIPAASGIHGIATSGWRGRSHSMGIADAVTVLAPCAATADAAATLIANAVDLPGNPAITRVPAHVLSPDSDLGPRLVTTDVGPLTDPESETALAAGHALAQDYITRGLVHAVCLAVNGHRIAAGSAIQLKEPAHA